MRQIIDAISGSDQDPILKRMFRQNRVIAIVGLSPREDRPSHRIATYLMDQGYEVIPVNPAHKEILNQPAYPNLLKIPQRVDLVDVFRRPEYVPEIVRDSIDKNVRVLWLQEGVIHPKAAGKASAAGIQVVMDRCIYRDHKRLIHGIHLGRILGEFRTQQGVSLEAVARQISMTPQELDALENIPESEICPDMVKRIASAIENSKAE